MLKKKKTGTSLGITMSKHSAAYLGYIVFNGLGYKWIML